MPGLLARKTRHSTYLTARLRDERGWMDVVVCNMSDHGMMLKGPRLPKRGTFVEIEVDAISVAGQVRWAHLNRCGIQARERIEVSTLLGSGSIAGSPAAVHAPVVIAPLKPTAEERAAQAKRLARAFQFILTACFVLAGAVLVGSTVRDTLAHPLQQVSSRLQHPKP